ncbi:sucrose operon repressor ScrR [Liquorilactobacillus sucicola DSM 21376 = JCM 15457]|uniref:LacI family transcription regulator n=2 Tax=Liquorilactobacillus sucicola TaxID=519050 RepID=A0A023CX92_9LACO|nr:LacI family transcription regulator [Liquorilactobacillus sucicola DSM 21376 = JCM 15457]GAJ26523.1 sucrose operon repressor ScrR [Liquorilactobacillus sucicola DSM 21376 = JCM 15457]
MVKISDVAELAQVSVTTVSRVINNYGPISEKTRKKVFSAMKTLNYQPNALARSLQGKKTKLIGIIFPGVSHPLFGELVQSLENQLFKRGYRVILCNSANNAKKEREYLKMLSANQVDGIITGTHNLEIEEYNRVDLPIISFDRYLSDEVPIVSSDNYTGGYQGTRLLLNSGARSITMITGSNQPKSPTTARAEGYVQALREAGLKEKVLEFPFYMSASSKSMQIKNLLMGDCPDAIFCSDDLTALLVLQHARKLKIRVPEDLKLLGYDGTQLIQSYHPELATVVQPISDIAQLMIELLIRKINTRDEKLQAQYLLPIKIINGSTIF